MGATLLRDLREERAEHVAAGKRTGELREELHGVDAVSAQLSSSQASRRQQQITQAQLAVPLRLLNGEVATLRQELRAFESGEIAESTNGAIREEVLASQADLEVRLQGEAHELSKRREALQEGQVRLEIQRTEVQQRTS